MRFLTISQCCCGMENGGLRGWDDPCTPCPTKGSGRLDIQFSDLLIIHEEKEKEITTVKEVWKSDLDYHKIW